MLPNLWGIHCRDCSVSNPCDSCYAQIEAEYSYSTLPLHKTLNEATGDGIETAYAIHGMAWFVYRAVEANAVIWLSLRSVEASLRDLEGA